MPKVQIHIHIFNIFTGQIPLSPLNNVFKIYKSEQYIYFCLKYFIASNTSPKLEWQTHAVDSRQKSEGNRSTKL